MRTEQPKAALYGFAQAYQSAVTSSMPVRTGRLQADEEHSKLLRKSSHGFPVVELSARGEFYPSIWHIIEYGSIKNPPYAPLRRGAERAALLWIGN